MIYSLNYTDNLPEGVGGQAKAWFIKIRPEYKDDKGILAHELCHVGQWWRTLGFHSILYLISKSYRLKCEVEAYRIQLTYSPGQLDYFAKRMTEMYGLSITIDEARRLLATNG